MDPDHAVRAASDLISAQKCARMPLVVAIDGGVGAGKSHLAKGIREKLGNVSILRTDHFFRPPIDFRVQPDPETAYRRYFPWTRMRDKALLPLLRGEAARYRRYDWETDRPNQWIVVPSNRIILVEGVFSSRPELRAFTDSAIFVDTPREERLRRMRARGHLARDPENSWLLPWMAVEDWYVSTVHPTEYAQLTLEGV
jgi:uridine kinase